MTAPGELAMVLGPSAVVGGLFVRAVFGGSGESDTTWSYGQSFGGT